LTQGLLQTVRLMPGYEDAIHELTTKAAEAEPVEPKIDLK
jgi:hypothetical protein